MLTNDAIYSIILHIHDPRSFLYCSLVCKQWGQECRKLKIKKAEEFSTHVKQTFGHVTTEYSFLPNSSLHGDYIKTTLDETGNFVVKTQINSYAFGSIINK